MLDRRQIIYPAFDNQKHRNDLGKVAALSIFSAALAFSTAFLPALADETSGPAGKAKSSSPSSSKHAPFKASELPLRTLGFLIGTVGGTPICMVKRLANDEVEGTRALVGETKSPFLLVPAGICWLPFAGAACVLEAPFYSMQNSIQARPFTKEQFSLGDVDTKE